ncbi:hypothetical protein OUZ56_011355 [Daphnia magna]|uniref:Uncharacterized protein n=1 Tax=Daphnia magna TaxID=35525 RepID=A0ABQ9Z022_9CRUS|nr:hypothetical protein OUZ56_011355 [Daphnia magna]
MLSVSDLSSLEDVVEENTLVGKDEFDRDEDLVEDGNGVSVGSMSKKRKVAPSQKHLIRDLVIDVSNWTTTVQLIRKKFVSNNNHMDVIFSDGVKCVKGVIYRNLCSKTYTLSKCRLKEYKGPVHNLPMLALQVEFSAFTECVVDLALTARGQVAGTSNQTGLNTRQLSTQTHDYNMVSEIRLP